MILYMYISPRKGLTTPWGQNFDVNMNLLSLQSYVASFKKSPWSPTLYNKCSLAGGRGPQGTKFWCQQICLVTSFICCKFKKKTSLKSDFIQFFFSWLNTCTCVAPAQGQRDPRVLNFGVIRKALSLFSFVTSFKEISLKSDFIQLFSWFNTCIQLRGRGQNFDVNRKALSLYPLVANFKEISLKSDFIQLCSWFNTCI